MQDVLLRPLSTPGLTHKLILEDPRSLVLGTVTWSPVVPQPLTHRARGSHERGLREDSVVLQYLGRIWGTPSRHKDCESSGRGSHGSRSPREPPGFRYWKSAGLPSAPSLCNCPQISTAFAYFGHCSCIISFHIDE